MRVVRAVRVVAVFATSAVVASGALSVAGASPGTAVETQPAQYSYPFVQTASSGITTAVDASGGFQAYVGRHEGRGSAASTTGTLELHGAASTIASTEAEYEQMWAQDVSAMTEYSKLFGGSNIGKCKCDVERPAILWYTPAGGGWPRTLDLMVSHPTYDAATHTVTFVIRTVRNNDGVTGGLTDQIPGSSGNVTGTSAGSPSTDDYPGATAGYPTAETGPPSGGAGVPTFADTAFSRVGLFISDGRQATTAPTDLSITDSRQPHGSGAAQLTLSHGSTPVETVAVPDGHRVEVPTTPLYIVDAHPAGVIDDLPHPELVNSDAAKLAQIKTHDGYYGFQLTRSSHLDASGGFQLQNTTAQDVDVSVTGVDIPYRAGEDVGGRIGVRLPGEVGWRITATTDGATANPVTVGSPDATVTLTSNGDLPGAADFREILRVHG